MPQGESNLSLAKIYNKFNYPKRSSSPPSSPYNSSQAPADEHRLTQRSNNRLYSKIAPLKRTYKKPLARRQKTNQYWLLPLTSTGHISDQYWLIFSSRIEYREYS